VGDARPHEQGTLYGLPLERLMTRVVGFLVLVLAGLTLLGGAGARDDNKKSKDVDAIFRKLDTNMDGRLSRDEFLKIADRFRDKDKARMQLGVTYDKLDPDRKGISRDQFRSFVETSARKKDDAKKGAGK
jgi:Ca2+-binding EF-hand superfamily protein